MCQLDESENMILNGAASTTLTLNQHVHPHLVECFIFLRKSDFLQPMISVSLSKNEMLLTRAALLYCISGHPIIGVSINA